MLWSAQLMPSAVAGGPRVSHMAVMLLELKHHIQQTYPYWNRTQVSEAFGGREVGKTSRQHHLSVEGLLNHHGLSVDLFQCKLHLHLASTSTTDARLVLAKSA